MKKFFLFIAAFAALSLTSCSNSGESSSIPDGQSQATTVDPNDPTQRPPQMTDDEQNNTNTEQSTASDQSQSPETEGSKAGSTDVQSQNTEVDPNANTQQ